MLNWCEYRHHVDYIVGIGKNSRLLKEVDVPMMLVRKTQWQVGGKVAETFRFQYQAHAWKYPRWVVARLEEGELGSIPGLSLVPVMTTVLQASNRSSICARGDMEKKTGLKINS